MTQPLLPNDPAAVQASLLPPPHCLLAFEALARTRSLAKAAHELRLSRNALTQAIDLLEHRLKLTLIAQTTPTVVLSEAGQRYFEATQAFGRSLRDTLHAQSDTATTPLHVTAPPGLSRLWLAPRIAEFVAQHPRLEILLSVAEPHDHKPADGVDISLHQGMPVCDGLEVTPLWQDRLLALAAPGFARCAGDHDLDAVLHDRGLIEQATTPWSEWLRHAAQAGVCSLPFWTDDRWRASIRLYTSDLYLAVQAAVQGLGVVLAPARLAQALITHGLLEQVSQHSTAAPETVAVGASSRPPAAAFLKWLRRVAQD